MRGSKVGFLDFARNDKGGESNVGPTTTRRRTLVLYPLEETGPTDPLSSRGARAVSWRGREIPAVRAAEVGFLDFARNDKGEESNVGPTATRRRTLALCPFK